MSDGGGESGREIENIISCKKKKPRNNDEFVQAIAKIAVAQVCECVGFQGFQQSALDTLSDVAVRYIRDLGKTAHLYANLSGRIDENVFDVIQGLEDLGLSRGFSGASAINRCLTESGAVRDIIQYVNVAEEIPFAYSIPSFPVIKEGNDTPSFVRAGESPPGEHIPDWLPAFPDPQTYDEMPEDSQREPVQPDTRVDSSQPINEQRKRENSLLNMRQRLANNGPGTAAAVDPGDAAKAKRSADNNPFLVPPLQFGEKEVSSVVIPPKLLNENMVEVHTDGLIYDPVSERFAPATESIKSKESCSEEGRRGVILKRGSAVQFKIGSGKKYAGKPMTVHCNDGFTEATSVVDENVKDGKKRRAEQIPKDSMENKQELAELAQL